MRTISFALAVTALAFFLTGCGVGIVYTHTRTPLSLNMDRTTVVQTEKTGDVKHLQFPYVGIAWDSAAYGDIAKKNGMKELYFADLETLKVLGIWNQYTVHLYGK